MIIATSGVCNSQESHNHTVVLLGIEATIANTYVYKALDEEHMSDLPGERFQKGLAMLAYIVARKRGTITCSSVSYCAEDVGIMLEWSAGASLSPQISVKLGHSGGRAVLLSWARGCLGI